MMCLSLSRRLCLILLLGSSIVTSAQSYTFKEYGQEQGLGDLATRSITQDHEGYLWVGTEHGLFRYDGAHFVEYGRNKGLGSSFVFAAHVDVRGDLWVGTEKGVYFKDQAQFQRLITPNVELEMDDTSSITSGRSGEVLINSVHELYSVEAEGTSWSVMPFHLRHGQVSPGLSTHSVMGSADGAVWTGCNESICLTTASGFHMLDAHEGVPRDRYIALSQDQAGNIWARGDKHILERTAASSVFRDVTKGFAFDARESGDAMLAQGRDGMILTPASHGIARWTGKSWEIVDDSRGLPDANVSQIFTDSEGIVWIGTRGRGVSKWLGYGDWEGWSSAQGIRNPAVFALAVDQRNRVWVANGNTIDVSDPQHHVFKPFARPLPANLKELQSAAADIDGSLWFGDFSGVLLHIHPERNTYEAIPVARGVHETFADSMGTLWVITNHGLYTIPPAATTKTRKPLHEDDPLLQGVKIRAIAESPDKTLWLGTTTGLFHRSNGRWHRVQLQTAQQGNISSVAAGAAGEVWIAGDFDGVARLRITNDVASAAQIYSVPTLSSDSVNEIVVDARGWAWIASDHGLDTLQGERWRHFDRDEGLIWNDTNEGALLVGRDGSAWIGTSAGLAHLVHPELPSGAHPLSTRIEEASWGGHPLALEHESILPWQSGDLAVKLAVVSYRNENAVSFRYRLVGLEDEWQTTRDHSIRYAKLPPGQYRFEVVSEDSGLHRVSPSASFAFEVRPPWWRTPLSLVLGVVGLMFLGAWIVRWRLTRLLEMQRRLEKKVAERTHSLQAERRELLETREVLRQQATRDGLTGLLNRTAILEVLDREWKRAKREQKGLAVIIADVDHFKRFNDTYGHIAGDEVLRTIANRLKEGVRNYDSVGRYGGEEFLIVLMGWNREGGEERLTCLWQSVCENPLRVGDTVLNPTSSFGVSGFSAGEKAIPIHELLISADEALYRAKARGRNRIEFARHSENARDGEDQPPSA